MSAPGIDAGEFREGQRRDWDTASRGWRDWNALIDETTQAVSDRMVEMAGIEAGDRVLDVAAGYGEPTLTAARVVGPTGSVVASDISSGMLEFGRERAAAAGFENIEFVESDAISLKLPARSFDAALSRFGIIFDPDGEGAAARVRGFLKPEARMAIASWGPPDRVPMLAVPMMTAMKRLQLPPPPPGRPGPLSRPTPEAIGGLLEGGGFSGIEVEEIVLPMEWDSPEAYTRFVREIAPPVSNLLKPHPQEVQDETWAAISDAAGEYVEDGRVRMESLALVAAGSA
ncbi:MAG TPA: methyltransferase domain-containing protein [Solirubrobacterales bacterium]|jgi:SAM-dependent methyltransferase